MRIWSDAAGTAPSADELPANEQAAASGSIFGQMIVFVRQHWLKMLAISAGLLAPCFWHRRIEATDLGSHLYNTWLAQLIERGQAPGLWIARQWSNVLFDLLLARLSAAFGLWTAEKIAVCIAVLVFFWGAFALASAAARRAPWSLAPLFAMIAYGWTFHMGMFNFYLALGLSFFSLAIFWRGNGWERIAAAALAPLVLMAHPLGMAWLLGAAAYIGIAEKVPLRYQLLVSLAAVGVLFAAHQYVADHYSVQWGSAPLSVYNGTDQLYLFGARYRILAYALLGFVLMCLSVDAFARRHEPRFWTQMILPLQLYAVLEIGIALAPLVMELPQYAGSVGLLAHRFTSVSAVLVCCLLGCVRPRRWHAAGFAGVALVFFWFVYKDTATVNKMEEQVERLVRMLPPGQRVVATIWPFRGSRVLIHHIVDRACIGHCFSYGNTEPASRQFRVRALPGNAFVAARSEDCNSIELGNYIVKPADLPMYQVYQCTLAMTDLCMRELEAGERNGRIGLHPAGR